MVYRLYILILFCIGVPYNLMGQAKNSWTTTEIELRDTFLVSQIGFLIKNESINNPIFNKAGYINVQVNLLSRGDTLQSYFINTNYNDKIASNGNMIYPHFYTILFGRLICIYFEGLRDIIKVEFYPKSNKVFRKVLQKSLPNESKLNQLFKMHGGKTIYVFRNGNHSVVPSKY